MCATLCCKMKTDLGTLMLNSGSPGLTLVSERKPLCISGGRLVATPNMYMHVSLLPASALNVGSGCKSDT